MSEFFKFTKDGIVLDVKLTPNSKKAAFLGVLGSHLKISVCSQPVENKANEELIKFLSKKLKVSKKDIHIISGHTSKIKCVLIEGLKSLPECLDEIQ